MLVRNNNSRILNKFATISGTIFLLTIGYVLFGNFVLNDSKSLEKLNNDNHQQHSKETIPKKQDCIELNLEKSNLNFLELLESEKPLILKRFASQWPASKKWDWNFLLNSIGKNTSVVITFAIRENPLFGPVLSPSRSVRFEEFVENEVQRKEPYAFYLNQQQYDDSNQFPNTTLEWQNKLSKDLKIEVGNEIIIREQNFWFTGSEVRSATHFDGNVNVLVQIKGRKEMMLFDPSQSEFLYPFRSGGLLPSNFARVDVENPRLSSFPKFSNAKPLRCSLSEGDALILPRLWWHSVRSFGKSNFAINYWLSI